MGWLWSSGASSAPPSATASSPIADSTSATTTASQAPPPSPATSHTDGVDLEIAKFLAQVQAEFGSGSSNKNPTHQSPATPSQQSRSDSTPATSAPAKSPAPSWNFFAGSSNKATPPPDSTSSITTDIPQPQHSHSDQVQQPDRLDPVSESLLPTTMSCRQAFDTAFHCNSLGGQWTSVYRAGTVRSCSEHWDNFWFCMRTRAYSGEMKEEAIRDYYRRKEVAKYYGPGKASSTDVWEAREEKVEPGTAFQKKYEMPDISDEEWWQMEIEHRRRVQEELQRQEAAAGR